MTTVIRLAGGSIVPFVAGSDPGTPKLLYADADLTTPLATTVVLDTAGRVTAFMASGGYDFEVYDSDDVLQYTVLGVEDIGLTWLSTIGQQFATGSKSVTSGYTILDTDQLVTVDTTSGAATINLLPAADYGLVLTIKNMGANTVAVTPDGSETIDGVASAFSIPAASSPTFPSIVLISDAVSGYFIQASHGL
jgi:hypothetical protein